MKLHLLAPLGLVSFLVAGCGAAPRPPRVAEPEYVETTSASSAREDMPPAAKEAEATPPPASATRAPEPAGGMIKIAAITLTAAKGASKPVVLEEDGTIKIDGKPGAKVNGDEVGSIRGTSMVTVGLDGSLVGNAVKPGYKLDGDDLVGEGGLRVSVGDDGTLTASKDGKHEVFGKAEGGASSKRTALILAALYLEVPASPGEPLRAEKTKKAKKSKAKKK
jgi:hypothetical protein